MPNTPVMGLSMPVYALAGFVVLIVIAIRKIIRMYRNQLAFENALRFQS